MSGHMMSVKGVATPVSQQAQDEYTAPGVSRFEAPTIRELAEKLPLNPEALEQTVAEFNASIQPGEFNPAMEASSTTTIPAGVG
jgi:hypothetical protein